MNDLFIHPQTLPMFDIETQVNHWDITSFDPTPPKIPPSQLLKWIGNKQRFASQIAHIFPDKFDTYYEPFLGSGAVLGALGPKKAIAADILKPLIDLWNILKTDPQKLYKHYEKHWNLYQRDPKKTYNDLLASYNANPNPLDFVVISRTCYGGVIRFTKQGKMSTPMGPHKPISPQSFAKRMFLWRIRVKNTEFRCASFEDTMSTAGENDIVYCDPPYVDSQAILYGAQAFRLATLWEQIERCKANGAKVALSIDGHKKSGTKVINLDIPDGIFKRELLVAGGSSMLKRLQKRDEIMIGEDVHDRLLLTW